MKSKILFTFHVILLSFYAPAAHAQNEPVLQEGTRITIKSKILNEPRDILVYLPPNYYNKYNQPQRFPVLYILDGWINFHSITGLVQSLGTGVNGTYVIPEMIVVAIPNTDRSRDLTPTHSTKDALGHDVDWVRSSGGNADFLNFIKTELVPKIDSGYRTFPYRILIGHSFGGIAAINALYTIPETFNAFVAIDPSLWWDNKLLVTKGKEYFMTANCSGKSLFIAQANTITAWDSINYHFEAIKEYETILQTRNHSGIHWDYKFYPDDSHGSVAMIAEYDALRFIFKNYTTNIRDITNARQLKDYFIRFSEETKVKFLPPEGVTQNFGSAYRYIGKLDIAEGFFQLNVDNYPQSSSAHANLGELWKAKGDKKKALSFYQASLKLYPENEDSRNNVETLSKELEASKTKK